MNAICGLVDWRGDRAGLEPFAKLLAALRHRGPDGAASWCGERVALGCQAHHTTPDAPLDRQPLHLADPDLAVAADVRLDNREDLIRRLGISGAQPPGPSDAGLILLAYQRWGEDFPRHLVGAFALALWDGRKRRLLLVRDPLGQRALFYAARGGSISFASEAKAILAAGQEPSPNLRTIARMAYPEARRRDNTATFFAGIKALPAATSMVLDADGARQTQYWTPDAGATLHFKRDEDLLEALLALLEDVVAAHTRALHPVAVLLSGGLDSSAITAIAARRLALDGASLTTLSSVLPPQAATGDHRLRDERDYIELFGSWPNIEQRFHCPRRRSAR
jgi:asparagine synthase (glutamine-hydrolysing)